MKTKTVTSECPTEDLKPGQVINEPVPKESTRMKKEIEIGENLGCLLIIVAICVATVLVRIFAV